MSHEQTFSNKSYEIFWTVNVGGAMDNSWSTFTVRVSLSNVREARGASVYSSLVNFFNSVENDADENCLSNVKG